MVSQPGVGGGGELVRVLDAIAPCGWWGQVHAWLRGPQSWTKKMENLYPLPLPPPIKDGKLARFGFCPASSLIWGDGSLLFHFILSKIAGAVSRGGRMVMM